MPRGRAVNPQSCPDTQVWAPSVLTATHFGVCFLRIGASPALLSEQDALLWNWAVSQRGQYNPKGQQHN